MKLEKDQIEEGFSDAMAKTTALALKRKVIVKGKQVRSATDVAKKIDYISIQLSTVAAMALLAVAMSGDQKSILSRAGVVSGLFSEDFPDVE
jgi:hypothetical protein